jgi:hypothetical protein
MLLRHSLASVLHLVTRMGDRPLSARIPQVVYSGPSVSATNRARRWRGAQPPQPARQCAEHECDEAGRGGEGRGGAGVKKRGRCGGREGY